MPVADRSRPFRFFAASEQNGQEVRRAFASKLARDKGAMVYRRAGYRVVVRSVLRLVNQQESPARAASRREQERRACRSP